MRFARVPCLYHTSTRRKPKSSSAYAGKQEQGGTPFGTREDKADTYKTGPDDIGGTARGWAVAEVGPSRFGLAGSEETHE